MDRSRTADSRNPMIAAPGCRKWQ